MMSEFLGVVAIYYLCDAMASARHLTMAETMQCGRTYDTVRSYFVPEFELAPRGTPEHIAQMRAGYLGFQAWEDANADTVDQMRAEAWLAVRGLSGVRS
jgi:hypothetical protein